MPEPIVTLNEETLMTDLRELLRRTVEGYRQDYLHFPTAP